MDPDASPFTPTRPVDAGLFVGRREQVAELRAMARKARRGQLQVGWISGERGIGKSSIAALVGALAEREEQAIFAHVHLGAVRELKDLARETHLQILRDNDETKSWGKKLWSPLGKRIKRIGLYGAEIELNVPAAEWQGAVRNFTDTLGHIVKTAGGDRKMLLLILDDINGLADTPAFANWLKSMVDGEATGRRKNPVCLLFVGLEERLRRMMEHNPSVGRVFQPMADIKPWTRSESEEFFEHAFRKRGVGIGATGIKLLARHCDGLPVMAHEIGNAAWKIAGNAKISCDDALDGVFEAAESVGRRFLDNEIILALRSARYRSILRKIAGHTPVFEKEFSRKQLLSLPALTAAEKKVLDNFLRRMRKLGALVPAQEGERGLYRFPTRIHRIYFYLEAMRARRA